MSHPIKPLAVIVGKPSTHDNSLTKPIKPIYVVLGKPTLKQRFHWLLMGL